MIGAPVAPAQVVRITGLHPGQQEVAASPARFKVVCWGRRSGKSKVACAIGFTKAGAGQHVFFVAPSYKHAAGGWRTLQHMARAIPGIEVRLVDKRLTFPGGGWIEVRTAGHPGGLRSEGLDLVIFDEAAYGEEYSWTAELRPSLADRKGGALFISTPKGRANWFHGLYTKGISGDPEWQAWQAPSTINPFLDPAEIEAAKETMPLAVWQQEFQADFLDVAQSPFKMADIEAMAAGWTGLQDAALPGHTYLTGWDLGRRGDATVGITLDITRVPYEVVAYDRLVAVPFPQQQTVIQERAVRFRDVPVVESNGPGDAIVENLVCQARPHVTTARSKNQGLQALAMLLERGALRCGVPQVLTELRDYAWNDSGLVQDSVMALSFCAFYAPPVGMADASLDLAALLADERNRPEYTLADLTW